MRILLAGSSMRRTGFVCLVVGFLAGLVAMNFVRVFRSPTLSTVGNQFKYEAHHDHSHDQPIKNVLVKSISSLSSSSGDDHDHGGHGDQHTEEVIAGLKRVYLGALDRAAHQGQYEWQGRI